MFLQSRERKLYHRLGLGIREIRSFRNSEQYVPKWGKQIEFCHWPWAYCTSPPNSKLNEGVKRAATCFPARRYLKIDVPRATNANWEGGRVNCAKFALWTSITGITGMTTPCNVGLTPMLGGFDPMTQRKLPNSSGNDRARWPQPYRVLVSPVDSRLIENTTTPLSAFPPPTHVRGVSGISQ